MATKDEVEYPRWVYPPDGGPGCIVQTPDEKPKGWLDYPTEAGPATGERIIGQPTFPTDTPPTPEQLPADEDEGGRKSKRAK